MKEKLEQKLKSAATALLYKCASDAVFFFRLEKKWDNQKTQTACTDGSKVYFNEKFVNSLTIDQLTTLIAHEVRHVKLLHFARLKNRDIKIANIAMDHAINLQLKAEGFTPLPSWYCDRIYINKTWEEIYALIQRNNKNNPPPPSNKPQGNPSSPSSNENQSQQGKDETNDDLPAGGVISPDISEKELKDLVDNTVIATNQMEKAGKMAGKESSQGMEKLIKEGQAKRIDWQDELREFFTQSFPTDYNYLNPDNFFAHTKFLFPSLDGETLESLNVYFDVSGSVSEQLFAYYLNILSSILNETGFQGNFNLFQFDTRILTPKDKANIEVGTVPKMIQGGGTCYKCIGKQAEKTPAHVTLIFTDGLCSTYPEREIENCVWIVLTPIGFKVPPFGKRIEVY